MENWITLVPRYSDFSIGLSVIQVAETNQHYSFIAFSLQGCTAVLCIKLVLEFVNTSVFIINYLGTKITLSLLYAF